MIMSKSRYLLAGLALLGASVANAGITLGGTRIIYPEKSKEVSILVKNDGARDIMIQSWLDPEQGKQGKDVPFAITPSLSRLAGNKQQMLRIFYFGQGLPADKESVFWLSVQEIPQKAEGDNTLQIALRQRIKVFYRPGNLPGSPEDAANGLKWQVLNEKGKHYLHVINNAPYFVSLSDVKLVVGAEKHVIASDMVSPFGHKKFEIKDSLDAWSRAAMTVEFMNINDYGAPVSHSQSVGE
ncbi:fimbrial biogenesis chaperone [Pseudomonas mosselii]|uniref:Molecular chaperone n=1 Tax=Pseudomonas mosselii TaxID=78327 RepID=A0AA42UNI8_9PSED|nr:molecular chaperone [Pseudomonas mosselii]MDH1629564.1 molecular chaperone [Pseudomonas mosselii]